MPLIFLCDNCDDDDDDDDDDRHTIDSRHVTFLSLLDRVSS